MQGELVIVRAFGNEGLVRRIWEVLDNTVYITDDARYHQLLTGQDTINPIGFPISDVFKYDEITASYIKKGDKKDINWRQLTPWTG